MQVALAVTTGDKNVSGREKLFNLEPIQSGSGKYKFTLQATPGKVEFCELDTFPVLGMIRAGDRAFSATPTNFYEFDAGGTVTNHGAWSMINRVNMAYNGRHVLCVDGVSGWSFDTQTDTLTQVVDPDFYPSSHVISLDSFFLLNRLNSKQYFASGAVDVTFDGLDFNTAEAKPDNITALIDDHREAFILGTESCEVHYNNGNADFPFQRNEAAFVEKGIAAPYSLAKMNNSVYFVGSDLIVYEMRGYQPVRISNLQIEKDLQDISLSDTFAYTYHERGQLYYVLTIPVRNKTWCFEATSRTWHERGSLEIGRDLSNCSIFFDNKTLVGDYQSGSIYHLSKNYFSEVGQPIIRQLVIPAINSGREFISIDSVEFDMKRGVGLVSGEGSDPVAWIRYSKDGGIRWTTHPQAISLGRIGETFKRVRWTRFGAAREFDIELNISDPVNIEIGGCYINE